MKRKLIGGSLLCCLVLVAALSSSVASQIAFIVQESDGLPVYKVPRGLQFPAGVLNGDVNGVVKVQGVWPVANGGTNASSAGIAAFNNITGYTAAGATGTTSTNLVFSTAPTLVTPTLGAALSTSLNNSGAITTGTLNFAADAQVSDTYVITLAPAPSAYATGMLIVFTATTANTGACTINVNALGAKALKRGVSTDPGDNFIKAGSVVMAVYDGTNFQMIQPAAQ